MCEHFDSPLADEFSRTLKEMELGLPRREALQNLKRRTEVPELSNFVLALTQADALGMPIGRVLKTQAAEMRLKRRQWAREKAAKLPVKILFPLVLFIFPPVFVVVLGPAVVRDRREAVADTAGRRTASPRSGRRSSPSGGAPSASASPSPTPTSSRPRRPRRRLVRRVLVAPDLFRTIRPGPRSTAPVRSARCSRRGCARHRAPSCADRRLGRRRSPSP